VHAMPSDPLFGYCPEESERWTNEVERIQVDVLIVGHTHTPFVRREGENPDPQPRQPRSAQNRTPSGLLRDLGRREDRIEGIRLSRRGDRSRIRALPIPTDEQDALIGLLKTGNLPAEYSVR